MKKMLTSADFSILNKDDQKVIYKTEDTAVNVMTFKIINATGEVLKLTGGSPVKQGEGGSSFNFNFESMLSSEVVKGLKITVPSGWASAFFAADKTTPDSWSVAPTDDVDLNDREEISITIENIICDTTNPGNFEIMYLNIEGYSNSLFPVVIHLAIQTPITPDKKTLPLDQGYTNIIHPINGQTALVVDLKQYPQDSTVPVYITYDSKVIENGFTYFLKNTSKDPLVSSTEDDPPVVYISFLFGESDDDITTQNLGDKITVDVEPEHTSWSTLNHITGTSYWQILPESSQIMDANETVNFPIKKIITILNTTPDKISTMYIQCNNFPGYNDANFVIELQKLKAKASITSFSTNMNKINFGESVKLSWISSLAKRVILSYDDRDGHQITKDSYLGQIGLNETDFVVSPTAESTKFFLQAYDDSPNPFTVQQIVTVIQPPATINSFQASSELVDVSKTAQITLTWNVENANEVLLNNEPITGTNCLIDVKTTTTYTLTARSYGQASKSTTSKLTIYAYRPGDNIGIPMSGEAMQTLPSIMVSNAKGRIFAVNSSRNQICDINVDTNNIERYYSGNVFTVSNDGTKLFIYNDTQGVLMYDIGSQQPTYPIPASCGPVYAMIVSPDMQWLYCASTHCTSNLSAIYITNNILDPSLIITIQVEQSPRDMIFNSTGEKLYVANYDSHSISVISVQDNSVKTIQLDTFEPLKFALVSQHNKLYLACEGENKVAVIDTNTDAVKYITVGNRPVDVLSSFNGQYVYVANFGKNTVSIIETSSDTVTDTLTVGKAPSRLALNKNNTVLFVANYCDKTLSIVDLETKHVLPQTLSTDNSASNPFDMAVYTEDSDYTRVYTAKESFSPRINCNNPNPNSNLNIAVYSIQEPDRANTDSKIEKKHLIEIE